MVSREKTFLERTESAIDRMIGVFRPEREARRRLARMGLKKIRSSQYAAAKNSRLIGDWRPVNAGVNDIIGASWASATARIRQLVRDFPYFARAVDVIVDYSVGAGILFQSRIRKTDEKLNRPLNQKIEDAFHFWADEADISGRLHFYEMMALAKRQDVEAGEFLLVKRYPKDRKRYLPYALQIFEPDWLTDYGARPPGRNKIHRGVEYDADTGAPIACHFTDPDSFGRTVRIPAGDVIHGFKTLRPGQIRGISPFTPGVLLADDLHDYTQANIDTAKMASKYLAFIYTENPAARQIGMGTDEDGKKIDEIENAVIEYLRSGEKVEIASNPKPGEGTIAFARFILSMLAVATGVPYELLTADYTGMNYSQGRTKRNDFAHEMRPISVRHIRHFCVPAIMPFFEAAVMTNKLDLPGFFTNPLQYLRQEWQPPGQESVDPLRETKAHVDQVSAGLRSPQEIVKARGRDLEDVYKEIAEAQQMAREMNIELKDVNTSLANNPAAINEENEEGDEDERKARIYPLFR